MDSNRTTDPRSSTGARKTFRIASKDGLLIFETETAHTIETAIFEAIEKNVQLGHAELGGLLVLSLRHPKFFMILAGDKLKLGGRIDSLNAWLSKYEQFGRDEGMTLQEQMHLGANLRHFASLLAIEKSYAAGKEQGESDCAQRHMSKAAAEVRQQEIEREAKQRYERSVWEMANLRRSGISFPF